MQNQNVSEIVASLFRQALTRLGDQGTDFTLIVEQNGFSLQQQGQDTHFLPAPIKMGTVLNFIRRLADRGALNTLPEQVAIGPYLYEPRKSRLIKDDRSLPLTDKERDILAALWQAPDHALDREALLKAVWAYADGVETHTLETHIYRLRQKMEDDPGDPRWLVNHAGMYRLNA